MREKETRRGPAGTAEALREAANRCPSEGSQRMATRAPDDITVNAEEWDVEDKRGRAA
ncbi:hypothetical protein GCM10010149_92790 [Nonomuraea roseoviolacea subsp. roseoviolacea]